MEDKGFCTQAPNNNVGLLKPYLHFMILRLFLSHQQVADKKLIWHNSTFDWRSTVALCKQYKDIKQAHRLVTSSDQISKCI